MPNIIELIAGSGIKINANKDSGKITLSSESNINSAEGGLDKNLVELIHIHTNGLIIDKSSTYKIPISGKYEIRLCGGGGSGAGSYYDASTYTANSYGGCGGNSGYLVTKELTLAKDIEIKIVIGAGGIFDINGNKGNYGNDTKVTINGETYIAKGGETNTNDPKNNISIIDSPSVTMPYDGLNGNTSGGRGYHPSGTSVENNGIFGAMSGGYMLANVNIANKPASGGGGGGGVIMGAIHAGIGAASQPAFGYGAGGGGSAYMWSRNPSPNIEKFKTPAGDGAQGAVQIKYLGK